MLVISSISSPQILSQSLISPSPKTAMNDFGEESRRCYFHAREAIVGVCALCLKERLLSLASKQGHLPLPVDASSGSRGLRKKPSVSLPLPKVFALGSIFLHHRSVPEAQKPGDRSRKSSIISLEDSFISINFEGEGRSSWEGKRTASVGPSWVPSERGEEAEEGGARAKSAAVVERPKQQGTLRWRKRIGQLFRLARWNRPDKTGASSHAGIAGKSESFGGRRGWMWNVAGTISTAV